MRVRNCCYFCCYCCCYCCCCCCWLICWLVCCHNIFGCKGFFAVISADSFYISSPKLLYYYKSRCCCWRNRSCKWLQSSSSTSSSQMFLLLRHCRAIIQLIEQFTLFKVQAHIHACIHMYINCEIAWLCDIQYMVSGMCAKYGNKWLKWVSREGAWVRKRKRVANGLRILDLFVAKDYILFEIYLYICNVYKCN